MVDKAPFDSQISLNLKFATRFEKLVFVQHKSFAETVQTVQKGFFAGLVETLKSSDLPGRTHLVRGRETAKPE